MAGLKRVFAAIKAANKAADRCVCGHKKRIHREKALGVCCAGFCKCQQFSAPTEEPK